MRKKKLVSSNHSLGKTGPTLHSLMSDEEKAFAAQEEAAQNDPDRLPDDELEEEYPR